MDNDNDIVCVAVIIIDFIIDVTSSMCVCVCVVMTVHRAGSRLGENMLMTMNDEPGARWSGWCW